MIYVKLTMTIIFLKQSRRACKKSIDKNPNSPISHFIMALSLANKKETEKKVLETAKKYKASFFVQYNTATHFMETNPRLAITYLNFAYQLQPKNVGLNKVMARFLFNNGKEEDSFKYFLEACLLTDGGFLNDFRLAESALRKKDLMDLVVQFQKGIEQCFLSVKNKEFVDHDKAEF